MISLPPLLGDFDAAVKRAFLLAVVSEWSPQTKPSPPWSGEPWLQPLSCSNGPPSESAYGRRPVLAHSVMCAPVLLPEGHGRSRRQQRWSGVGSRGSFNSLRERAAQAAGVQVHEEGELVVFPKSVLFEVFLFLRRRLVALVRCRRRIGAPSQIRLAVLSVGALSLRRGQFASQAGAEWCMGWKCR